jgi:hypothetical protein
VVVNVDSRAVTVPSCSPVVFMQQEHNAAGMTQFVVPALKGCRGRDSEWVLVMSAGTLPSMPRIWGTKPTLLTGCMQEFSLCIPEMVQ